MQNFRQKANQLFANRLGANTRAIPQIAVPFQRRNSLWQQVPGAETSFTVSQLAVTNGNVLNIWTAGAGNALYIVHLSFSSSNAGAMAIQYNSTNVWTGLVLAGTPVILAIAGYGMFLYPAAQVLRIVNNTGANSDLRATAWGSEVVA